MKIFSLIKNILLISLLISQWTFSNCQNAQAAFDVKGVALFKDNSICIFMAGSTTPESLNLANLTVTTESVQSKISSGGSLCPLPPFFTGGAILTTVNGVKTQADPVVQSLGRGILISEIAGDSGGVSSSGDPGGFNTLIGSFGGFNMTIFEISLPQGCDVIDDDDDIDGLSSDLSTINDFSFPTCISTTGIVVACNTASNLLTAVNGLVQATDTTPAKIRFVISDIVTSADGNMIDSILVKLDSQDIFCPSNITGPLNATVIANNAIDTPSNTQTIGTANIGTPAQAAKISYAVDTATSQKGESSTNETGTTPILAGDNTTTANTIQIEELNNEGIPVGGQTSPTLINPSVVNSTVIQTINILLIPSYAGLFSKAPSSADISFSDDSLIVSSDPYIVKTNTDDFNAPFGTLVIPVRQKSGGTDPSTVKTTIQIKNIVLAQASSVTSDSTISLSFFEPISGAIVNIPGAISIFSSATNSINPQNFSSFAPSSARGIVQNTILSGAVNDGAGAQQIVTDTNLSALTARDTVLGTPQIINFTKVVSSVTPVDTSKINTSINNSTNISVITFTGNTGASIGGAKIKIDSLFDSVTVTSKNDGSFTAKIKADFLNSTSGVVSVNFTQIISGKESEPKTKNVIDELEEPTCFESLCGSCDNTCAPTITSVQTFIQEKGGLANVVSSGGLLLQEVIKAAKKALGLS